jgi:cell wall-associated NlpC family hydrolase
VRPRPGTRTRLLRLLLAAVVTFVCLGLQTAQAAPASAADCRPLKAGASTAAQDAVTVACRYVGIRYAWGGGHAEGLPGPSQGQIDYTDPASFDDPKFWSFDCIGLVRWAWYKATGQDIVSHRTTQSTWQNPGYSHQKFTKEQGEAPLLPGDILHFKSPVNGQITHVALYLGEGKMVEAPNSGAAIRVADVKWDRYQGAFRPNVSGVLILDEKPGEGKMHKTWGQPNLRRDSHTGSPVAYSVKNSISVAVRTLCQRVGEKVTVDGMENNVWSYLPDYHSWISNLFIQGPAVLPDVPACSAYRDIGGTLDGAQNNTSCADGSQPQSAGARTAKSTTLLGRTIELRYNDTTACAWGRISGGTVGDEIWVDRSGDGGGTWESMLGFTRVDSGGDAFTTQWNDNGPVMRACGSNGPGGQIACTAWY